MLAQSIPILRKRKKDTPYMLSCSCSHPACYWCVRLLCSQFNQTASQCTRDFINSALPSRSRTAQSIKNRILNTFLFRRTVSKIKSLHIPPHPHPPFHFPLCYCLCLAEDDDDDDAHMQQFAVGVNRIFMASNFSIEHKNASYFLDGNLKAFFAACSHNWTHPAHNINQVKT